MGRATRIEQHTFTAQDKLLLDTNIWLFIHCPHHDPADYAAYSDGLKRMLEAKSRIFVTSTVLGEFIYRYLRLAHDLLLEKGACPEGFKDFRRSAFFPPVAKAVADGARRILKQANRMDEDFVSVDITKVLAQFESSKLDYNDLLIAEICERENLTLITDDQDFSARNLPILTANALLTN